MGIRIRTVINCAFANLQRGGVRGIGELEILKQLEQALGGGIQIQQLFDLIVGTR